MKLKTKLYLGFILVTVSMLLLFMTVVHIQTVLQRNMNDMADRYEKAKQAQNIRFNFSEMERRLAMLPQVKGQSQIARELEQIQTNRTEAVAALDTLQSLVSRRDVDQLVQKLRTAIGIHEQLEREMIAAIRSGQSAEFARLLQQDALHVAESIYPEVEKINEIQDGDVREAVAESESLRTIAFWTGIGLTSLAVLIGAGITLWIARLITRRINRVAEKISGIAGSGYENIPRIDPGVQDEIGQIAVSFNSMADALEEHVQWQREYRRELEEESWLKRNYADITTNLQPILEVKRLCRSFIDQVAPTIGAPYAVMYVKNVRKDGVYYAKAAGYAHSGPEPGRASIRIGEGLVGQCAIDGKTIRLSGLPESYFPVRSGLGEASPRELLVLPVLYQNEVTAVVEFAFLEPIGSLQEQLVTQLLDGLGLLLDNVQSRMHIEKLLVESRLQQEELQAQAEELQGQAEELQLQQEELRTANDQMEKEYAKAAQRTKELEQIREELERKAAEVEQASRYKSEFLANMSHELRTPLNSLLILSQLLLENKEGNLYPNQLEFARTIHQSGTGLLLLINDILDLSKVESGHIAVHREEYPLHELVGALERQFRPVAEQKGLDFAVRIAPDCGSTLYTDAQRLQQIVTNFLSNAFKFTGQGEVRFDIYVPDSMEWAGLISSEPAVRMLAFAVSDTGIGIPPDKHGLIFEAFRQADGSTSRSYGGSGLGLSICRELSALLGGAIALQSDEGKGSRFTLYLPDGARSAAREAPLQEVAALRETAAAADLEPASDEAAAGEPGLAGKQVLIVDDDMRNVFALTAALEAHGMKALFAETGQEAIDMLRSGLAVDIVLMDIMMPKVDGYEAMRTIRGIPGLSSLPIIALTAKAMKHDRDRCIEAGASDYISKPVHLSQLLSLIRVWLYA